VYDANQFSTRVAETALALSNALAARGYRVHQHRAPNLTEQCEQPHSIPIPAEDVPEEARVVFERVATLINDAAADAPQPHLRVPCPDGISSDPDGSVRLPLPAHIEPHFLEREPTFTPSEDAVDLWRQLVPELVEQWIVSPVFVPLSWGRFFLGPRRRLLFWPRAINRILAHIPIKYDHIWDLVRVFARCGIKIDLKAAFRSIRISLEHSPYYGACIDGIFLECRRAPFGSTCSPAHFVLHLAWTVKRHRMATPRFDEALAAFVDDLGQVAGGESTASACINLAHAAERLVRALIEDGWWISIPKCFLRPADPLYYTGFDACLKLGTIRVNPTKAAKLRALLGSCPLPAIPVAGAPDPTGLQVAPAHHLRLACASATSTPIPVAAMPLVAAQWPRPPVAIVAAGDATVPAEWSACPRVASIDALLRMVPPGHPPAPLSPPNPFVIIIAGSVRQAMDISSSWPTQQWRERAVAAVVAYPTREFALHAAHLSWFDPTMALTWDWCNPLPPLGAAAPQLPLVEGFPPETINGPLRTDAGNTSVDMTPAAFAAMRSASGYMSWLSMAVPLTSAWRPAMETAWRSGRWSSEALTAVRFLWDLAPWLPGWQRNVRREPPSGFGRLHVTVDTATGSWCAVMTEPAASGGRRMVAAGIVPWDAWAAGTLAREAWGVLGAVKAAIAASFRFYAIDVTVDNLGLAQSGQGASIPSDDAAVPMRCLAALSYQGVDFTWTWKRRSTPEMQYADAGTTVAAVIACVWPLRVVVASMVWDVLGGWDADGPSAAGHHWAPAYLTPPMTDADRSGLFAEVLSEARRQDEGWIGDLENWNPGAGQVLFSHPPWSLLGTVASFLARRPGLRAVVVAPAESGGEWWTPDLLRIQSLASTTIDLPRHATSNPRNPTDTRPDPRRLRAYIFGQRPASIPARPRPAWWTPWRLTQCGDVESNPGPIQRSSDVSRAFSRQPPVLTATPHVVDGRAGLLCDAATPTAVSDRTGQSRLIAATHASTRAPAHAPMHAATADAATHAVTHATASTSGAVVAAQSTVVQTTACGAPARRAVDMTRRCLLPPPQATVVSPTTRTTAARLPPVVASTADTVSGFARCHEHTLNGASSTPAPSAVRGAVVGATGATTTSTSYRCRQQGGQHPAGSTIIAGPDAANRGHRSAVAAFARSPLCGVKRVGSCSSPARLPPPRPQPPRTSDHHHGPVSSSNAAAPPTHDRAGLYTKPPSQLLAAATSAGVEPTRIVAEHAATGTRPTPLTMLQWVNLVHEFMRGGNVGASLDHLPENLRGYVAAARATTQLKARAGGGSQADKAARYMRTLVLAVGDAPFCGDTLDAFATAYAIRRLEPYPPFKWRRCNDASTPDSDLSRLTAASRRAGVYTPPKCGPTAAAYLDARGANDSKDSSDAWPIHLAEILRVEPKDCASKKWRVWSGLVIFSAFCLRPGVLPFLKRRMFVPWQGGYILIWRWRFKSGRSDILDPELKSKRIHVTGARFDVLHRILGVGDRDSLFLTDANNSELNAFVRAKWPNVPKGFTLRAYGARVAADISAMALGLDEDMCNALFWWRRSSQSMRLYYGALSILRMYLFSEARLRLKCVHFAPGSYDAKLKGNLPDLSPKAILTARTAPLPAPDVATFDAAWNTELTAVATARLAGVRRIRLPDRAWQCLEAGSEERQCPVGHDEGASASDGDTSSTASDCSALSVDCEVCRRHLDRKAKGTLCETAGCRLARCEQCQRWNTEWRCPPHAAAHTRAEAAIREATQKARPDEQGRQRKRR
jgi:hypothetical protein